MKPIFLASTTLALCCIAAAVPKDALQDLLSRMDEATSKFKAMSANLTYTVHTQVIDDDSKESGSVVMKLAGVNQVQAKIEFTQPNPRTALFEGRKAQVYYPKTKTLQIYDLGDKGDQVDRFVMLGFGTSGTELARDYTMRIVGAETIQGKSTSKLELIPKVPEVKKLVSKIEMWIPDAPAEPYPIQEKIYENSGDYRLTSYSDFQLNPKLSSDALKLKLPKGVNIERPQK